MSQPQSQQPRARTAAEPSLAGSILRGLAGGLAEIGHEMVHDARAAYAGVFWGGAAINQPYLTGQTVRTREEAVQARLDAFRDQVQGQNQEHDQSRGR